MTLLTICQNAADEVGIERQSSIIGNPSPTAQKLLRYANKAGDALMKADNWQVLRKERTFSAVGAETQTSIFPSDFDRIIKETFWNRSVPSLISGPASATEWQGLKATSYSGEAKFALRGDVVLLIPAPTAGQTLAFEYISNQWCKSAGGSGQTAFAADTDVGILDEELILRYLKLIYLTDEGLPNGVAAAEARDYRDALLKNDQPDARILVSADIFNRSPRGQNQRHFSGVPAVNTQTSA